MNIVSPRTSPPPFPAFLSRKGRARSESRASPSLGLCCSPAARLERAGTGLGRALELGWRLYRDWAGKLTRTRLGSVPGLGWGACRDWDGKLTGTGLETVLALGWEVHWDQAGSGLGSALDRAGNGLGSALGLGWEAHQDWTEKLTRSGLGSVLALDWEAYWEWAGKRMGAKLGSLLGLGWEARWKCAGKLGCGPVDPSSPQHPFQSSKKAKTAEADTSSELAKKSKEVFRKEVGLEGGAGGGVRAPCPPSPGVGQGGIRADAVLWRRCPSSSCSA